MILFITFMNLSFLDWVIIKVCRVSMTEKKKKKNVGQN